MCGTWDIAISIRGGVEVVVDIVIVIVDIVGGGVAGAVGTWNIVNMALAKEPKR